MPILRIQEMFSSHKYLKIKNLNQGRTHPSGKENGCISGMVIII